MTDIFISYARVERDRIQPIIKALEAANYNVWWDPALVPGANYRKEIKAALDAAKCVLVVWSRASVESEWVTEEAEVGKGRGILVPVILDQVTQHIPLGLRSIQVADLTEWDGTAKHKAWKSVIARVQKLVPYPSGRRPESKPTPDEEKAGSEFSPDNVDMPADEEITASAVGAILVFLATAASAFLAWLSPNLILLAVTAGLVVFSWVRAYNLGSLNDRRTKAYKALHPNGDPEGLWIEYLAWFLFFVSPAGLILIGLGLIVAILAAVFGGSRK